jgi:ABC-type proline/glycine betaine transport system ATPase subunit
MSDPLFDIEGKSIVIAYGFATRLVVLMGVSGCGKSTIGGPVGAG